MQKRNILVASLMLGLSAPAFAQFGGLLQNVIGNATKQAVQQGVEQGVQQGVTQAIAGTPEPAAQPAGPMVVNGCYVNLPAAPAGMQGFNPDRNGDGCINEAEAGTYLYAVQTANASNAARTQAAAPAAAPASGAALGSVIGSAIAVKNAGGTGNAAAWVAGQNALGAAVDATHGQPAQVQTTSANPADGGGNAAAGVVGSAVGGALKGLFGR